MGRGKGVKLYFYSLRIKNSKPILKIEECDATMENGLFRASDNKFPCGGYGPANPKHIGKLQVSRWEYELPFVMLAEPDIELAKRVLSEEYIDRKIEFYKQKIAEQEEKRKAIEEVKEQKNENQ